MSLLTRLSRAAIVLVIGAAVAAVAWYAFVFAPTGMTDLLGILLAVVVALVGLRMAGRIANSVLPGYNVAEVAVEGPITRDAGGVGPLSAPTTPGADAIVEQIERADEDRAVDALLVKLNTPGGEVVPSDDIREAAAAFDGPTIGYTNDLCASGGMWIASGCDELWARDGTLVGSIGVVFSQLRVDDLFEEQGVSYERIVSGDYKDALSRFKALEDDEREYLQGLSDAWYDNFVERMAAGSDMDADAIRDTEARVYLGEDAVEMGMVDDLGDREAVEAQLEDELGAPVTVETFEPSRGLGERLRGGAQGLAYAFGAGIAGRLDGERSGLRLR